MDSLQILLQHFMNDSYGYVHTTQQGSSPLLKTKFQEFSR